jgi:hypothetical protein
MKTIQEFLYSLVLRVLSFWVYDLIKQEGRDAHERRKSEEVADTNTDCVDQLLARKQKSVDGYQNVEKLWMKSGTSKTPEGDDHQGKRKP